MIFLGYVVRRTLPLCVAVGFSLLTVGGNVIVHLPASVLLGFVSMYIGDKWAEAFLDSCDAEHDEALNR